MNRYTILSVFLFVVYFADAQSDFNVNPGTVGRSGKAPLVFAGYGFAGEDRKYNDLKNKASMTYTKANAGIEELTKKHIEEFGINLDIAYRASERPAGGSDHAPFAQEGIPIFYFMAAMHPDYHLGHDTK